MNNVKPTLQELRKQAESNSPEAWFQLAQAHMGLQEPQEAHGWYRRAAEAGHVPSQVDLARQLLHGNGVVADPGQAAFWLRRAEPSDHPVAAYLLALLSLSGVVVPYDNRINDRLTKAVNAGFAPALRAAAIHFGRKPDPADQQRCLQLLQHGMQRGDWVSALLLAERLQRGEGCKPNLKAARAILDKLDQNGIAPLPALTVAAVNRIEGPANTLSIDDTLQSPTAVSLSEKPKVWVMDGLLSADECRLLIALARPVLQPSRAIDLETGKPIPLSLRTMSDVTFDPVAEDLSLRMVQQRMATAAGVEFFRAESLRVMRQESGDEVLPPVGDYLPPGSGHPGSHIAGNRAHTICVYLNQPEAGGEIQFPAAGFNVKTQTARAVIFDNLQADGSPDLDSQHSALPVKRGEKWLATLWLREGRYRNF